MCWQYIRKAFRMFPRLILAATWRQREKSELRVLLSGNDLRKWRFGFPITYGWFNYVGAVLVRTILKASPTRLEALKGVAP